MIRVTTKIVWDSQGNILEHSYYTYDGPIALCCGGATAGEQAVAGQQASFFDTLMNNYNTVFGDSSSIFKDLTDTFSPIVKAGPNQEGYNQAELQTLNTAAIQNAAQATKNAEQAAGQSRGGGNVNLPSGAATALQSRIQTAGAMDTADELNKIRMQDYAQGRANWSEATRGLAGAPGVFGGANAMAGAATTAGSDAFSSQKTMADQRKSTFGAIMGTLGGIAGAAMGNPAAMTSLTGLSGGGGSQGDASGAVFTGMAPGTNAQGFGPGGEDYSQGI